MFSNLSETRAWSFLVLDAAVLDLEDKDVGGSGHDERVDDLRSLRTESGCTGYIHIYGSHRHPHIYIYIYNIYIPIYVYVYIYEDVGGSGHGERVDNLRSLRTESGCTGYIYLSLYLSIYLSIYPYLSIYINIYQ